MQRVSFGIVGSGFMGQSHAKALAAIPDACVRWICGRDTDKVSELASQVGGQGTTDLEEVLADPLVDAVLVCVPTGLHKDVAIEALRAGKRVLCEKPVALTLAEADAMIAAAAEAARRAGIVEGDREHLAAHFLMIGHVLRFWPEYEELQALNEQGAFGGIASLELERLSTAPKWADWFSDLSMSGGMVVDLMVHDFDIACSLLGVPQTVTAWGAKPPSGDWKHVHVLITFAGGGKAHVVGSHLMPPAYPFTSSVRVVGEQGAAEYRCTAGGTSVTDSAAMPSPLIYYSAEGVRYPLEEGVAADPYARQLAYFIGCVRENRAVERGTPLQAKTALAVALAARQSLATGTSVGIELTK